MSDIPANFSGGLFDFFFLVISKYIAEMVLTVLGAMFIKYLYNSKFMSLLILLSDIVRLNWFQNILIYALNNHKVYSVIDSMFRADEYLKYVKNKDYKRYSGEIVQGMFLHFEEYLKDRIWFYCRNSVFENTLTMSKKLKDLSIEIRNLMTFAIRSKVHDGLINERFCRKILVHIDYSFETMSMRVESEVRKSKNSYVAIIDFLFILTDYLKLFKIHFPFIVNSVNGNIKKKLYTEDEVIEIMENHNG